MGRYYQNEQDMLSSEQSVRKSTLDYISTRKQEEGQEDEANLKFSQMNMDLGVSTSGFLFPNGQEDSPYFNSNAPTPEFGNNNNLMDSLRFRKSIDGGAFEETMKKY